MIDLVMLKDFQDFLGLLAASAQCQNDMIEFPDRPAGPNLFEAEIIRMAGNRFRPEKYGAGRLAFRQIKGKCRSRVTHLTPSGQVQRLNRSQGLAGFVFQAAEMSQDGAVGCYQPIETLTLDRDLLPIKMNHFFACHRLRKSWIDMELRRLKPFGGTFGFRFRRRTLTDRITCFDYRWTSLGPSIVPGQKDHHDGVYRVHIKNIRESIFLNDVKCLPRIFGPSPESEPRATLINQTPLTLAIRNLQEVRIENRRVHSS